MRTRVGVQTPESGLVQSSKLAMTSVVRVTHLIGRGMCQVRHLILAQFSVARCALAPIPHLLMLPLGTLHSMQEWGHMQAHSKLQQVIAWSGMWSNEMVLLAQPHMGTRELSEKLQLGEEAGAWMCTHEEKMLYAV